MNSTNNSNRKKTKVFPNPFRALVNFIRSALFGVIYILKFLAIVNSYVVVRLGQKLLEIRIFPSALRGAYNIFALKVYSLLNRLGDLKRYPYSMSMFTILDLALKNLRFKRSRAVITISGMSVGIAAIVFLVSIGFGLQELVINSAIRLEEMKQAEINTQPGSQLKLSDAVISDLKKINEVENVYPVIAVVGAIEFSESVSDIAIYGVTDGYLKDSAVRPISGEIFGQSQGSSVDMVLGASTNPYETGINQLMGSRVIIEGESMWLPVRNGPRVDSTLIGWTNPAYLRNQSVQYVSGGEYSVDTGGRTDWFYGYIKLWTKGKCEADNASCVDGIYHPTADSNYNQVREWGYIQNMGIRVEDTGSSNSSLGAAVLGISDQGGEDNSELEFIELEEEEEVTTVETIPLRDDARKEIVLSRSTLNLLGLSPEEAIGKTLRIKFSVTNNLLVDSSRKIESMPAQYTVVGVISDQSAPFAYVPLNDIKGLGISYYSQIRVVARDNESLDPARKKIESLGLSTSSVADTKRQIDQFFETARVLLAIIGSFALGVACLGMFNTLTVSLLERTREVGLLKAIGMRPEEVRMLFLSESMIIGFYGGLLGLLLGFMLGEGLSLALSILSISKGYGYIDVASIPPLLAIGVVAISFMVGFLTGLYPASRSTRISALNALRYE